MKKSPSIMIVTMWQLMLVGGLSADEDFRTEVVPSDTSVLTEVITTPDALGGGVDYVFRGKLVTRLSFIPHPKRVVNTAYVFQVEATLKIDPPQSENQFVTVHDTGGFLRDGRGMDTVDSYNLKTGAQYVVYARRIEGQYRVSLVLLIGKNATLSDASGRLVTGLSEARFSTSTKQTRPTLRYHSNLMSANREMENAPDSSSIPLPQQPTKATETDREPFTYDSFAELFHASQEEDRDRGKAATEPKNEGSENGKADETRTYDSSAVPLSQLSGKHITSYQSHFYFMPDNNNWDWATRCRGSWNVLVEPKGGIRLFTYKIDSDGNPIRNRLPVADNNTHNVGVLSNAQMTTAGYDTWTSLNANGVCYRWWNSSNRIVETDILINPSIDTDEVQFRKSLTHEFGHALTLDHEDRYMALLFAGTFRQPPNYRSHWYSRADDHWGVQHLLKWVNDNIAGNTWDIAEFTDMATWSQAHPTPGTAASDLAMTTISDRTLSAGETATMRNVHIENRGSKTASNVRLKFYLSSNNIISSGDREIASFLWSEFATYWHGDLNVRIPPGTPNGNYFLGWILTTDSSEESSSNNTALLLNSRSSGFSEVTVRIQ